MLAEALASQRKYTDAERMKSAKPPSHRQARSA
jgi:hypothetical protein